jgi:hypothetical protein
MNWKRYILSEAGSCHTAATYLFFIEKLVREQERYNESVSNGEPLNGAYFSHECLLNTTSAAYKMVTSRSAYIYEYMGLENEIMKTDLIALKDNIH